MKLAILAIIVQAGATSPAPAAKRPSVTILSRSEASSTVRRLRVIVRIDPHAPIKSIRIANVIESIQEIWRPYAEIDFAETGSVTAATYDDELRLVITDRARPPGSATAATLGWIEFFDGRPRNTITVSVAAARTLMSRGEWLGRPIEALPPSFQQRFVTRVLSRSAAHEIGHYLLRSPTHAAHGLMRERMTVNEVMDDAPELCRLLPSEIAWLDQVLSGALAEAPAADPHNMIIPPHDRKS